VGKGPSTLPIYGPGKRHKVYSNTKNGTGEAGTESAQTEREKKQKNVKAKDQKSLTEKPATGILGRDNMPDRNKEIRKTKKRKQRLNNKKDTVKKGGYTWPKVGEERKYLKKNRWTERAKKNTKMARVKVINKGGKQKFAGKKDRSGKELSDVNNQKKEEPSPNKRGKTREVNRL